MKLNSFRELLIKKAGSEDLETLVKFMKDEILAEMVIESLQKMARAAHKGSTANFALRDFATEMDPELEPAMIHDALSHHASRYKQALKENRSDVANHHAGQFYKIMNLADKVQKHTDGKLHVDAPSPHAWERNAKPNQYTEDHHEAYKKAVAEGKKEFSEDEKKGEMIAGKKRSPGDFVTDTKGWNYRPKDYSFLQQAPHPAYAREVASTGHAQAYPMEAVRINGKHLHIEDDIPASSMNKEPHPFDKHPIMEHYDTPASKRTQEDDMQYMKDKEHYYSHEASPIHQYFDKHEKLEAADPESYAKRGSAPSKPVHAPVKPLDVESLMKPKGKK